MKNKKFTSISTILFVILALYTLILAYHFIWGLLTSLKDYEDYLYNPLSLPEGGIANWKWDNYAYVFQKFAVKIGGKQFKLPEILLNTVIYVVLGSFICTIVPYVVAYVTARYNFWFCKVINAFVIVVIALPIVGGTPAVISVLNTLNLYDSFFGALLLKFSFLNMYYLVFFAAFQNLPREYQEAAEIDGAGELAVMIKIMFPMAYKAFLTVFLIFFVDLWNDYQGPILYLYSYPVLARGVYNITNNYAGEFSKTPIMLCACMMLFVPIMIIFSIFSKQLMGNISMGGLKE